ncbi:12342_t:CDS:2, partial [Racocetra persica]
IFSSYGACLVFVGSGNCADIALGFGEVTIVDVIVGVMIFVGFWGLLMFIAYFVT